MNYNQAQVQVYLRLQHGIIPQGLNGIEPKEIDFLVCYLNSDHCLDELKVLARGLDPSYIRITDLESQCGWKAVVLNGNLSRT